MLLWPDPRSPVTRREKNLQMRILFNWFSIEALLKFDRKDNVAHKAMLGTGFPIGQKMNDVEMNFQQKIRNNRVHSGLGI